MSGLSFLDFEGSDPVEEQRRAGQAIAKTKHELDRRGFKAFIMHASSLEELSQRMVLSEVDAAVDDAVRQHMNFISDAKSKIEKSFHREWIAANQCNCGPGCKCVKGHCECPESKKSTKTAEKETIHLRDKDVKIEKGKLTREVGGKPSEHMDKVRELAEEGHKDAQFYVNVLHHPKHTKEKK